MDLLCIVLIVLSIITLILFLSVKASIGNHTLNNNDFLFIIILLIFIIGNVFILNILPKYMEKVVTEESLITNVYDDIHFSRPVKIIIEKTSYPYLFFSNSEKEIIIVD